MQHKGVTVAIFSCPFKNTMQPPACASSNALHPCLIDVYINQHSFTERNHTLHDTQEHVSPQAKEPAEPQRQHYPAGKGSPSPLHGTLVRTSALRKLVRKRHGESIHRLYPQPQGYGQHHQQRHKSERYSHSIKGERYAWRSRTPARFLRTSLLVVPVTVSHSVYRRLLPNGAYLRRSLRFSMVTDPRKKCTTRAAQSAPGRSPAERF